MKLKKYLLIVILSFLIINNIQKNLPLNPNEQPIIKLVIDDLQNSSTVAVNENDKIIIKKIFIIAGLVVIIFAILLMVVKLKYLIFLIVTLCIFVAANFQKRVFEKLINKSHISFSLRK